MFPRLQSAGPDGLALDIDGRSLSYRELATACEGHLRRLESIGAAPGDTIALPAERALENAVAIIAQLVGGYITLPLNPKLGHIEYAHVLSDATPALTLRAEHLKLQHHHDALSGREQHTDSALLLYTSGTTGMPKGVQQNISHLTKNLDALAAAWRWNSEDTLVHALPIFHVHGLILGLLGPLRTGGAVRILSRFDVDTIASTIKRDATLFFGVPTMHRRCCDAAEARPEIAESFRTLRAIVSGSAGLSKREHVRVEQNFGMQAYERYGMTETLINTAVSMHGPAMPGAVGTTLTDRSLRLVSNTGTVIAGEGMGEIQVRGNIFEGYRNRPEANAEAWTEDGWFRTGDLATRDANDVFSIQGRLAIDLIKTAGYRVGAGEVEAVIRNDIRVTDVAVIGVPDDDLGQRIEAFVEVNASNVDPNALSADLAAMVAGDLSAHKRPRAVHIVTSLPRNALGKIQKKKLLGDAACQIKSDT